MATAQRYARTIHPARPAERREAERYAVRLSAAGQVDEHCFDVCIDSISFTGIAIEVPMELAVGSRVEIALPGAETASATVRWTDGQRSGCAFDRPIRKATLSAARLQGGGENLAASASSPRVSVTAIGGIAAACIVGGSILALLLA
jgi:hypothetical protein